MPKTMGRRRSWTESHVGRIVKPRTRKEKQTIPRTVCLEPVDDDDDDDDDDDNSSTPTTGNP